MPTEDERNTRLKAKINLIKDFLRAVNINDNRIIVNEENKPLIIAIEAAVGFKFTNEIRLTHLLRNPFRSELEINLKRYSTNNELIRISELLQNLLDQPIDNEKIAATYNLIYSLLDLLPLRDFNSETQEHSTISQYTLETLPWARLSDLLDTLLTISNFFEVTNGRINWEKPSDAYIISIKIRGIHGLLGEAKKMRELYMNSFLISILVWLVAEKFVRELGGDILLSPNIRRTPMLGMIIKKDLEKSELPDNNRQQPIKKLIKFSKELTFYDIYEESYGYPIFATIPGEVILILPKSILRHYINQSNKNSVTKDSVLEFFDKKMRELQNKIIRLAKERFLRYIRDLDYYEKTAFCGRQAENGSLDEEISKHSKILRRFSEFVCRAFILAEKYGFFDAPLLDYQINVLEISYNNNELNFDFTSSIYLRAKEIFSEKNYIYPKPRCGKPKEQRLTPIGLISSIFKCLNQTIWSEEFKQFLSSPPIEEISAIARYTTDIYEDKINYFPELYKTGKHNHCSVCGQRPAIFGLPPYKKQQERSPLHYEDTVPWILQPYFDAREHLCAHCLIKRILIIPEIFKSVFKELFGMEISPLPKFVSTTHLAIMANTLTMIKKGNFDLLRAIRRKIDELNDDRERSREFAYIARKRTIIESALKRKSIYGRLKSYPLFIRNLYRNVIENKDDEIKKGFIYLIEIPEYELIKLGIHQLNNIDVNNYVTLMYCDGDNFTKFILLDFKDEKELTPIGELDLAFIRREIFNCYPVDYSLLYYRTISYAISVSSGIEQAIFLKGTDKIKYENGDDVEIPLIIPVLFGGDDVILFTTVDDAFTTYELLRKIFTNGIREEKNTIIINDYCTCNKSAPAGFNIYRGIVSHAFPHLVRSFHIAFIHHKYPLGKAILNTIFGLDAKDDIKINFEKFLSKKDVLIISFMGRGQRSVAVMPISLINEFGVRDTIIAKERSTIDLLLKLYNGIFGMPENRKISVSFLYDIFSSEELLAIAKQAVTRRDKLTKELRRRLFSYILKRNFANNTKGTLEKLEISREYLDELFDTFLTIDVEDKIIVENINETALLYSNMLKAIYGETKAPTILEIIRGLILYKNAKKTIKLKDLVGE